MSTDKEKAIMCWKYFHTNCITLKWSTQHNFAGKSAKLRGWVIKKTWELNVINIYQSRSTPSPQTNSQGILQQITSKPLSRSFTVVKADTRSWHQSVTICFHLSGTQRLRNPQFSTAHLQLKICRYLRNWAWQNIITLWPEHLHHGQS